MHTADGYKDIAGNIFLQSAILIQPFVNYSSDLVVFQAVKCQLRSRKGKQCRCLFLKNNICLLSGVFQSESGLNRPMLLLLGVQAYLRLMPGSTGLIILATQFVDRFVLWYRSLLIQHAGLHWMHPSFSPTSVCAMFKHAW